MKLRHALLAGLLALLQVANVNGAEIGGYVSLTSDYVRRGVTQSDGDPALQVGGDLRFDSGFFLGAWASTVDISRSPDRERDLEVDYYAGYALDASERWQFTAMVVLYTYPGQTGPIDYDYEEYSITSNYNDRLWIEYSYSPDLYHSNRSAQNIDVYAEWPLNSRWSIGLGAGHYDTSDLNDSQYTYWQIGITRAFAWADLDFRYHDTDTAVPFVSSPRWADSRVAITLQIPFSF